jgi:hypothetical protein
MSAAPHGSIGAHWVRIFLFRLVAGLAGGLAGLFLLFPLFLRPVQPRDVFLVVMTSLIVSVVGMLKVLIIEVA